MILLGVLQEALPSRSTKASGAYTVPVMAELALPVKLRVLLRLQPCHTASPAYGPEVLAEMTKPPLPVKLMALPEAAGDVLSSQGLGTVSTPLLGLLVGSYSVVPLKIRTPPVSPVQP